MESAKKNILLVSYVFPPYYGIGGRRWAKHSEGLVKLGYTVHVICAQNPFKKSSLWSGIIENNPGIVLHEIPGRFPKVLIMFEHNIFQKLMYKVWITILPLVTRGSYLDRSVLWKQPMLKKARQVIADHKITSVICSGGPFGAMYQTTLLKKWFSDIFIMNDLRDPWTWGLNWGFHELSKSRMAYESELERLTITNSDIITVPTLEMKVYLDKKYPLQVHKIKTLLHFFDRNEITVEKKTEEKKVRLILYGSIYHHISDLIEEAAQALKQYENQVILDVYTDKLHYKTVFEKYGAGNVTFYEQLPPKDLFKLFVKYDYVFLMLPSVGVDHISTKFYEIIYARTPFLIFCKSGLGPKFVVENNLGIHVEPGGLFKTLGELVLDKKMKNYNTDFALEEYSLENNVKHIQAILNENK